MNAERLSLILKATREDMDSTEVISRLTALVNALNTLINEPNEQNQQQVTQHRKDLYDAIEASKFMQFPRTWRSALEELGIYDFLGVELKKSIEEAFERSQITVVEARDKIQEINSQLAEYHAAFTKIIEGFDFLELEEVRPTAGEAELSILIPSDAFDNELKRFAEEIRVFDRMVKFFAEMTTGSREPPEIKQLSTTDPFILIALGTSSLLAILKVVEKFLDVVTKTYGLRQIKAMAEKEEVDLKIQKSLDKEVQKKIEEGVIDIQKWLFKEYQPPKPRAQELETEAKTVLQDMATRIDQGYQIDGDAGEIEPEEGEEEQPDDKRAAQISRVREIKEIGGRIRYAELPSEPVLKLPKRSDTDKEDERPEE